MNIYNGNCVDILNNLSPESIDLCVTDPPYKTTSGGNTTGKFNVGKAMDKTLYQKGQYFSHNDITFSDWLPAIYRVMKPGTHTYIMCNPRNLKPLMDAVDETGFEFQQLLIWEKGNVLPNKFYMNAYEIILMLKKERQRWINDMGMKNILTVPSMKSKTHPTEKPVELMEILISQSSKEGEIVLDPFMGTGSTGTACRNLNRNFIGIELDKEYFDIAHKRLMPRSIAFAQNQREEVRELGDVAGALHAESGTHQTTYIALENHPNDSRIKMKDDEICQTLSSRMGTGGNNEPMVLEVKR